MTLTSTHTDSLATRRATEFFPSDTRKQPTPGWAPWLNERRNSSKAVVIFDLGLGIIHGGSLSLGPTILETSEETSTSWNFLPSTGSVYAIIADKFLTQSDVSTSLVGVCHAEEFNPQLFHDVGEQQSLLNTPRPTKEALEFLSQSLISFSESLVELVRTAGKSSSIPVLKYEWSVFADPEDSSKELVLGVTVNATSDQALEFWDVVSEKVSAKQQEQLSLADQLALSKHLSIQIYWP